MSCPPVNHHDNQHADHDSLSISVPDRDVLDAASELLRVLSSPIRIAVVVHLRQAHACVHELVEALGVTQPLVSQHLRILKSAGVVTGERCGREVVYSLCDHHLSHIVLDAIAHVTEEISS